VPPRDDEQRILHRALLGEAAECAAAAAFVWDDDRRYVAVNDEACRLVGLSRSELVGMPVGSLSGDGARGLIARTQEDRVSAGSSTFTRRDGTVVALDWVTMHTRVAGLPYMLSLCWLAGDGEP
jgi:PAS domain S-box-containing protein